MDNLSEQFFRPKTFNLTWQNSFKNIDICIEVPDLSQLEPNIWGDWGPNYSFKLDSYSPLKVSYDGETHTVEQPVLNFYSPFCASTREQYPLYFCFSDDIKCLEFTVWLDHEGQMKKVKIKPQEERIFIHYSETEAMA